MPVRVGDLGAVEHYKVRFEVLEFFLAGANEHVFDKVRLPGHFRNKADFQASGRVGTAVEIVDKQPFAAELLGNQCF